MASCSYVDSTALTQHDDHRRMMPRKIRSSRKSAQGAQQQSDHETGSSPAADVPNAPSSRTNNELNLSVLRRHNAEIDSILSIAPFVVVYTFPASTKEWEKCGIEGTLFVCQLISPEPGVERYAVVVLNRRGLENFTAELRHGDDVEITPEYVILQVQSEEKENMIHGLWIFSEPAPSSTADTRATNAQIIHDCAVQAETSKKLAAEKKKYEVQEDETAPAEGPSGPLAGRRLSIRELFGPPNIQRDRVEDGKVDAPPPPPAQFTPSADTEFFRSTTRPSQMHKQSGPRAWEGQRKNGV